VLSPGADPLKEINKLAIKMEITSAIKVTFYVSKILQIHVRALFLSIQSF
jgi:hypothetical protein